MRILFATVIPVIVVVAAVLLVLMFPAQHIVRGVMVNVNALFEFSEVIPATVSLVQGHLEVKGSTVVAPIRRLKGTLMGEQFFDTILLWRRRRCQRR